MKQAMILLVLLSSSSVFAAGIEHVYVNCKTKTAELKAYFPGNVLGSSVVFKTGNSTKAFLDSAAVERTQGPGIDLGKLYPRGYHEVSIGGVNQPDIKVITITVVRSDWKVLELVAIPETVKMKIGPTGRKGQFSAKVKTDDLIGAVEPFSETMECEYYDPMGTTYN